MQHLARGRVLIALHRPGGLQVAQLREAGTRLTVDAQTPTLLAIWRCSMRRWRSSTMSRALSGSMLRGE